MIGSLYNAMEVYFADLRVEYKFKYWLIDQTIGSCLNRVKKFIVYHHTSKCHYFTQKYFSPHRASDLISPLSTEDC